MPTPVLARFLILLLRTMAAQTAEDRTPREYRDRVTVSGRPWRGVIGGSTQASDARLF